MMKQLPGDLVTSRVGQSPHCPNCLALLDATTGYGIPSPGDLSICYRCGVISRFTEDMSLTVLTLEDIEGLSDDLKQRLAAFRAAVAEIREEDSMRDN